MIVSFRFAREDGTCTGSHYCGIFAKEKELPAEIREAKQVNDLTPEQRKNFVDSVNIEIDKD
jgi:hypothetical protein